MNIYISREIWADRFSVYIRKRTAANELAVMQPAQFRVVERKEEGLELPPAMQITKEEAQDFMDSLWTAGLRPTEGSGSAGSLAATERHLSDMRSLVFKIPPK